MRVLVCVLLAATLSGPAAAEVLNLPPPPENADALRQQLPGRGLSMTTVEARLGTPTRKSPAVGGGPPKRPPITRWDYPGYSVFFEKDRVIDAVIKGAPKPLRNVDALRTASP